MFWLVRLYRINFISPSIPILGFCQSLMTWSIIKYYLLVFTRNIQGLVFKTWNRTLSSLIRQWWCIFIVQLKFLKCYLTLLKNQNWLTIKVVFILYWRAVFFIENHYLDSTNIYINRIWNSFYTSFFVRTISHFS